MDKDVKTQKGQNMKKLLISAAVCVAVSTAAVFSLKKKTVEKTVQEYLELSKDKYDISYMLMRDIIDGRFTVNDVKEIIEMLSEHFKPEEFVYTNEYFKTPKKPWSDKTLQYLEMLALSGENSKEFFICLAEVSDYLRKKKRS